MKYVERPEPIPEEAQIEAQQIASIGVNKKSPGNMTLYAADPAGGCGLVELGVVKADTSPQKGDYWQTTAKGGHVVPKDEFEARYMLAQ